MGCRRRRDGKTRAPTHAPSRNHGGYVLREGQRARSDETARLDLDLGELVEATYLRATPPPGNLSGEREEIQTLPILRLYYSFP
jgi:hypothetical protein